MRNLFVNKLRYHVVCEEGSVYGAIIKFDRGLNIIYGPNSVGKSSVIIGIIYGLGMEKSLGIFSSKQNPFKPEFYDKIDGKKIIESNVYLEITNGSQVISICRPIIGKTATCIIKEGNLDQYEETNKRIELIAEGKGVMTEDGLQGYMFDFLEWDIVDAPTYEGEPRKIYLENLAPLFYVEQRAGWSQIQARQVTRYGIKDIKKIVFEYLMGLDKFDIHLVELKQKEIRQKINETEAGLLNKEDNLLILANATKDDDNNIFVEHSDYGKILISDLINNLKEEVKSTEQKIKKLTEQKEKADSLEIKSKDKLREISNVRRVSADKVNILIREISSYTNYIKNIEINRQKNLQLKRIDELGSKLNVASCPICETTLTGSEEGCCHLCKENIQKISTPDENIAFLEDEKASFLKILTQKEFNLEKAKQRLKELKQKEREFTEKLNYQLQTYYGEDLQKIRGITAEADSIMDDIQKLKSLENQWKGLEKIRDEIKELDEEEKKLKTEVKKYTQSVDDESILRKILTNFKRNISEMRLFKEKGDLIKEIRLDENDSYTPYLQSYDIYNISSSSDNIRIILSYYLALLQTSVGFDVEKIRFPNILILDEPKQQNLDEEEIETLIRLVNELDKNKCQVILTTFANKDREKIKQYFAHEMKSSDDYLLKLVKE